MAPLAAEPRQLLVVLNVARRRALYSLVEEITAYMRAQLELPAQQASDDEWDREQWDEDATVIREEHMPGSPATFGQELRRGGDAPLFVSRDSVSAGRGGGARAGDRPSEKEDYGDTSASATARQREQQKRARRSKPSQQLITLRRAAIAHLDEWRRGVLDSLKEIVSAPDDGKIVAARQERQTRLQRARASTPARGENLIDLGPGGGGGGSGGAGATKGSDEDDRDLAAFQELYHPIPTRLNTISRQDREETLSSILVLILSKSGAYTAHSRTLAAYLASALALPMSVLVREETEIARSLVESSTAGDASSRREQQQAVMSAEREAEKRRQDGQASRFWKVGLASVAGAAVIGITGGLAAPVVAGAIGGLMGSVGLGGVASFLGIFWMNGALVGTLFGAFGARMTGEMMDQYAREVEDFRFLPLSEEWGKDYAKGSQEGGPKEARRLRVTIGINGWLTSKEEVTKPWRSLGDETEVFGLQYEMNALLALGNSLEGLVSSYAWSMIKVEILKRTVLASLWAALWPAYLIKAASTLDNPFSLARNRSEKAGRVLADALVNRVQGERPVTLVGYSLGARVIYSCLRELAARRAFGLVDQVVLIGAPVPSDDAHWREMRSVVSGKMFNVFSENDYILAFLYRATSIQLGVAGLQEINPDIEGVVNLDLSSSVSGHLRYPSLIAPILTRCGFPNVRGGDGPIEEEEDLKKRGAAITLRDDDGSSKTGNLIDFGDGDAAKSLAPPGGQAVQELPGQPRTIATVPRRPGTVRSNSDVLMQELDPLGVLVHMDKRQASAPSVVTTTSPTGKQPQQPQRGRLEPQDKEEHKAPPPISAVLANTPKFPMAPTPFTSSSSAPKATSQSDDAAAPISSAAPTNTAGTRDVPIRGLKVDATAAASPAAGPLPAETLPRQGDGAGSGEDSDEDSHGGIKMVDNDEDLVSYVEPIPLDD